MNRITSGTVEGTGATINIDCGFIPAKVNLYNIDGNCYLTWVKEMGAGTGQKTVDSATGATDVSFISTLGITVSGATDSFIGFKIGADTDLNDATTGAVQTIVWDAVPDRQ